LQNIYTPVAFDNEIRTMASPLFSPLQLREITLTNRIVVAPMCQYSAEDGNVGDWQLMHLGHLSHSGAAMLIVEAIAVTAEGRITPHCTGLWCDTNEAAFARVLKAGNIHPCPSRSSWRMRVARPPARHPGAAANNCRNKMVTGERLQAAIAFNETDAASLALDKAALERIRDAFVQAG